VGEALAVSVDGAVAGDDAGVAGARGEVADAVVDEPLEQAEAATTVSAATTTAVA
jgi:hypothetical protein